MTTVASITGRRLAVVVVAYGSADLLERCLSALGGTFAVTVVDNGSCAATHRVADAHGARYLDPGSNLGFAAGVNRALESLDEDTDVLLLNPDAEIGPAEVRRLHASLVIRGDAACVAPAQRRPGTDTADAVLWPFPSPVRACLDAVGLGFLPARKRFVVGSVLLLRAEAIRDVGDFDERYFLYAEESDWQLRAQRRGWASVYEPSVSALHIGAATSGDETRRAQLFEQSYESYIRKWYGVASWQLCRAAQIVGSLLRAAARSGPARREALARAARYRHRGAADAGPRPLRVVQVVCSDAFAGVERYVATLAVELSRLGCTVEVVGGARGPMLATLTPAGVRWHAARGVADATRQLIKLRDADVVHAHMSKAELAAVLTKAITRASTFSTRHFAQPRGSSAAARAVTALAARGLDRELAISDFVAQRVEREPAVVRPGVARHLSPTGAGREQIVLVVQRLEPEKETELAIDAFAASGLARQGWRLVIAGGGRCLAMLQRRAADLGIAGACEFVGPRDDVDALYERASILFASRPDEPFGLSVVEAMAHALPIVAAAGGGHLETVGRVRGAALFAAGDANEAARMLRDLANDPTRRDRYGSALQAAQAREFTIERLAREVLDAYQSGRR